MEETKKGKGRHRKLYGWKEIVEGEIGQRILEEMEFERTGQVGRTEVKGRENSKPEPSY